MYGYVFGFIFRVALLSHHTLAGKIFLGFRANVVNCTLATATEMWLVFLGNVCLINLHFGVQLV